MLTPMERHRDFVDFVIRRGVQLDVRAFNAGAIRFYQALGFAPALLRLERVLT